MIDELLAHIKTVQEADEIVGEIEMLLESLYEKDADGFKSVLKHRIRYWVADYLKRGLEKETDAEAYLKSLEKQIKGLEELNLTLAYEPTEDALERFSSYVKQNIGSHVLLRISYDPNIIGGAIVIYEGEYRDFSFKRIFESQFETSKSEILKTLRESTDKGTNIVDPSAKQ
jgi:hypothetical protein